MLMKFGGSENMKVLQKNWIWYIMYSLSIFWNNGKISLMQDLKYTWFTSLGGAEMITNDCSILRRSHNPIHHLQPFFVWKSTEVFSLHFLAITRGQRLPTCTNNSLYNLNVLMPDSCIILLWTLDASWIVDINAWSNTAVQYSLLSHSIAQ
jgi:hypothetical protein